MVDERNLLAYQDPELIAALEHHLRRRSWKQADLSRRTGINTSTISDWLNGRYGPGAEALRAACQAFGVSRSQFWQQGERIVEEHRKEEEARRQAEELAGLEQKGDTAEFRRGDSPSAVREGGRDSQDRQVTGEASGRG